MKEDYFKELEKKLIADYKNKQIFPPRELIFNAFNLTPFNKVRHLTEPVHPGKGGSV